MASFFLKKWQKWVKMGPYSLTDLLHNYIRLLKSPFLASLLLNFSAIYSHMSSKFTNKSSQKISIFSGKANYARGLMQEFFFYKKEDRKFDKRILCIDDEPFFCHFVQHVGDTLNIQVDICFSYFEAKEIIKKFSDYDAFIIDGHLADGSGIELIAWMRQKKKISAPIAFLSRIYRDATSFKILKEALSVNYVLEKPIEPKELHQLLLLLCEMGNSSLHKTGSSNDVLSRLYADYQKTIPSKIERLESLILAIQKNPSVEHLYALHDEVHKIAGSAGFFGYHNVSVICLQIQTELMQQIELAKKGEINLVWLSSLEEFLKEVKLYFQIDLLS